VGGGKILTGDAWNADHSAERALVHPFAAREPDPVVVFQPVLEAGQMAVVPHQLGMFSLLSAARPARRRRLRL
jgi:hypothetical protein